MRGFLMNPLFDRRNSDMLACSRIPFGVGDLMLYDFPKMFSELEGKSISVDVKEDDTSYKVSAELPGCDKNNISVDMDDDVLKISASYEDKKEEKKEKEKKKKGEGRRVRRGPFHRKKLQLSCRPVLVNTGDFE